MQSQAKAYNVSEGVRAVAEPLPQHAEAKPYIQTSTSVPQRRLTTRELSRRRPSDTDGVISGNKAARIADRAFCTGNFALFQPVLAA